MSSIHELSNLIQMTETTIIHQKQEKALLQEKIDELDAKLNEDLALISAELEHYIKILRKKYAIKHNEAKEQALKTRQQLENQKERCDSNIQFAQSQANQHKKQLDRLQEQMRQEQEKQISEHKKHEQIKKFKFNEGSLIYALGEEEDGKSVYYHIIKLDTYNDKVIISAEKCLPIPRLGKLVLKKTDDVVLYEKDYDHMLVHDMPFEIKE